MPVPRKAPAQSGRGRARRPARRGVEPLRPFRDLMRVIAGAGEEHAALRAAVMAVCEWTGWEVGEAWVPRADGAVLECSPACFVRDSTLDRYRAASMEHTVAPGEGLPGRVWSGKKPEWIRDAAEEPPFLRREFAEQAGFRQGVGIPVPAGDEILAVLTFFSRRVDDPGSSLADTLTDLGISLGLVIRRLRAEEALRRSESRFRAIYEGEPECVKLVGVDGTLLAMNPAGLRMIEAPDESAVVGRPVICLIHPEDHDVFLRLHREAAAGRNATAQFRIIGLCGGRLWMEAHSAPLRNAQGEVTSVLSVARDVTQRKWVEEALKRERDFVAAIFDTAGALVNVVDRHGRVVRFNRACEEASGYTFEEVRARPFWDVVLPLEEVAEARTFFRKIDSIRFPAEREGDWLARDGTRRRISWSLGAIPGPDGKIEFVVGTGIDITGRRQAEERERERSRRALRYQSSLLRIARIDVTDLDKAVRAVTEIVAETLEVDRVGVWSFAPDRTGIVCDSQFIRSANRHESGTRLAARQYPAYSRAIEESRTIAADGAQEDPRTREFTEGYLVPFGITSMLDVPIRGQGMVKGVLCCEHTGPRRSWTVEEQDFAGSAADMISLAWEATERRRAEEALRDREARIKVLVEHIPGILWSVDGEYRITSSVGAGVPALGLKNNQIVGTTLQEYVQSSDPQHPAIAAVRRALEGKPGTYEMEFQGRSFDNYVDPLRGPDGKVYACVGLSLDVTDRRKVETENREREARLRLLVDQLPGVLWSVDADLRFTSSVGAGLSTLGLLPNQVVGMSLYDYFQTRDPDHPSIAAHRRALAGQSVTYESGWKGRTYQTHVEPLRDSSGKVLACLGFALDVTERKEAEEGLRRLNEDLERRVHERTAALEGANKELEAFSYSVSHDLRAPVRAIDGFSKILIEEFAGALGVEGTRLLGIVRKSTAHMGQLIDDLLSFARLSRKEVEEAEIDMTALAQSVIEDLRKAEPARDITVMLEPLAPVRGDRPMMRQAFTNLLSNAWKFTRRRSRASVRVGCRSEAREFVYFVTDNGVGFEMQYVHKLFGVFQRLHLPEEFEGTGVGLAIVQRIVWRHQGRVWAEGAVGEGATFYFALPRRGEVS